MTFSASWCRAETASRAAIDALADELARSPLARQASLLQDPRWLSALAEGPEKGVRVYVWRSGGALLGYAGFLVHPSAVRLALGELTLLARRVRRLSAFTTPLIPDNLPAGDAREALAALLEQMSRDLAPGEVIFLESVISDTPFRELLARPRSERSGFFVLQNGKLYQHCAAALGNSLDAYLKQLSARTRADLRSTRKKFAAHVHERHSTHCFRTPDEVAEFVADAITVSEKTYQYRLLDSGLQDREALERAYRATADLGWFRSYVLYVEGRPVAFQVGHVYGGRYHAQEIGYDPEWARHHAGIFLHTEIIADLCTSGTDVQWFDFGIGDSQHKQRLSTDSVTGGYFYLIPGTWRGSILANSMRASNAASAAVGTALERLGLRQRTRQLLRKIGAAR